MKPKNPNITISELGVERTFVSGNKNWRIDYADFNGNRFEVGTSIKWIDKDARGKEKRVFKGKIEWLIIIDDGTVDIAIDHPEIGRLELESVEFIKAAKKNK